MERFWTLSRAGINSSQFIEELQGIIQKGDLSPALELCRDTRGPVASICGAGLQRAERGIEQIEKAIMNTGSIEMAFLEKNLVWLSTIIAIAPMLGFLGTVWGMILAFKAIEAVNDISPSIVAGGISVSLITTLFGLVVAIIIQTVHNYFVSRIDQLVINMEESSIELIETLIKRDKTKA